MSVQLGERLDSLSLDRMRLKQGLTNDVSNAIKFSHPGGTVTLRAERDADDLLRLEVQAQGGCVGQHRAPGQSSTFYAVLPCHSG